MLAGILRSFADQCPKADLVAFSGDPAETQALHGIRAVHRMSPAEVIGTLRETDLLLSGGGSLLQDVTSSRSLMYYLAVIWLAKRLGVKAMVYGQGVGPIVGSASRRVARWVLNQVDLITVRDEESKLYLEALGVNRPEIRVTADPSFAAEPAPAEEAEEVLRTAGAPEGAPLIGVSLRPWRDQARWLPSLARGLDSAAERVGASLVFLPMQHEQDLGMSVQVASQMTASAVVVAGQLGPAQALAVTGRMSLVVGMRLHALIFAACMGVPFVGVSYDPKVDAFARAAGQDEALKLGDLDAADVAARVTQDWERRAEFASRAKEHVQRLRAAASANAEMACELIGT